MFSRKFTKESLLIIITLIPIVIMAIYWELLPNNLPVQWGISGTPNDYAPKYVWPLILAGTYLLLLFLPKLDPRSHNYNRFSSSYYIIRLFIQLFSAGACTLALLESLNWPLDTGHLIMMGSLLMISIIGNYMTTLKPNWFIGIRTPWTLEDDKVWRKTHKLGGYLWFWGGLLALIIAIISPQVTYPVVIGLLFVISVIPIIYSFILYRQYHKKGSSS